MKNDRRSTLLQQHGPLLSCVNCGFTPGQSIIEIPSKKLNRVQKEINENSIIFDISISFGGGDVVPSLQEERGPDNNLENGQLKETIKVQQALSSVYKLKYLQGITNIGANADDGQHNFGGLCGRCGHVFSNLYKYYTQFNQIRALDSKLAKEIVKFDEILLQLEETWSELSLTNYDNNNNNNNNNNGDYDVVVKKDNPQQQPDDCGKKRKNNMQNQRREKRNKFKKFKKNQFLPESSMQLRKRKQDFDYFKKNKNHNQRSNLSCDTSQNSVPWAKRSTPAMNSAQITTTTMEFPQNDDFGTKTCCPVCQKSFTAANDLHVHLKMHLGAETRWCSLCSLDFGHPEQLYTHLIGHAQGQQYSSRTHSHSGTNQSQQNFVTEGQVNGVDGHQQQLLGSDAVEKQIKVKHPDGRRRRRNNNMKNVNKINTLQHPAPPLRPPETSVFDVHPNGIVETINGYSKGEDGDQQNLQLPGLDICTDSVTIEYNDDDPPPCLSPFDVPDLPVQNLVPIPSQEVDIQMEKYFQCDECSKKYLVIKNLEAHKKMCHPKRSRKQTFDKILRDLDHNYYNSMLDPPSLFTHQDDQEGPVSQSRNSNNNNGVNKNNEIDDDKSGQIIIAPPPPIIKIINATVRGGRIKRKCPLCPESFAQESDLTLHLLMHSTESDTTSFNVCPLCPTLDFPLRADLVKHLRCHTSVGSFQCSFCGKCYNQIRAIQRHEAEHKIEEGSSLPYRCTICPKNKGYKSLDGLTRHRRMSHRKTKEKVAEEIIGGPSQKEDGQKMWDQEMLSFNDDNGGNVTAGIKEEVLSDE